MKKNFLYFAVICLIFFSSCKTKTNNIVFEDPCPKCTKKEKIRNKSAQELDDFLTKLLINKDKVFDNFFDSLSLKDKVSQMFIVNIEGNSNYKPTEEDYIPGGYLFFAYNLDSSPEKIMEFTNSIRKYSVENNTIPSFLAIDQEGGLVNRLRNISGPLPSAESVVKHLDLENAALLYEYQAKQMKLLGFDVNLAPVVEVLNSSNKDFLGNRSFGNEQQVLEYGSLCVKAFENNGIATVLKHFPGNSNTDPHVGLPVINLTLEELENDLQPFYEIIQNENMGLLMSHAIIASTDKNTPSCLSSYWTNEVLRNRLHYNGIIFSDDIYMGALAKNGFPPEVAVVKAVEAGVDCIMISDKIISESVDILCEKAEEDESLLKRINESSRRILQYKLDSGMFDSIFNINAEWFIIPAKKDDDMENRVKKFNEIKDKNLELHEKYFK